jgi:hypothetical protein
MLAFSSHLPRSYGGVMNQMTWKQIMWFNIFYTLLALLGIWLFRKTFQPRKTRQALFA